MENTDEIYSAYTKDEVRKMADSGDARAICEIGIRYMTEQTPENYRELALGLFEKAAEMGESEGFACLGDFYDDGSETDSLSEAVGYYETAAKMGNTRSMYILATLYEGGDGVRKSRKKAFEYYLMGAEAGDPDCQLAAGQCLIDGDGVQRSVKKGYAWVEKAAAQGEGEAYYEMALCCLGGHGVKKDTGKYFEYMTKAAETDVDDAQAELAAEYYYGEITEENPELAFGWGQKAAWRGNEEGQLLLGIFYSEGYGCRKDTDKACHWLKKAAEQENANAMNVLEEMYAGKEITEEKYRQVLNDILDGHRKLIDEGEKPLSGWLFEPEKPASPLFAEEFLAGVLDEMEEIDEYLRFDFTYAETRGGMTALDVRYAGNGYFACILGVTKEKTSQIYARILDGDNLFTLLKNLCMTLKRPRLNGWVLGEESENGD